MIAASKVRPRNIRFSLHPLRQDIVLVATTPTGVCAILIGGTEEELTRDLHGRFPRANLVSDTTPDDVTARVINYLETAHGPIDFPLDLVGTPFQIRVWKALLEIPVGTTATYSKIAEGLGLPYNVRAVAGACAANHLAVVVPCHRVVKVDGGLAGYRWGLNRKRALLLKEGAVLSLSALQSAG